LKFATAHVDDVARIIRSFPLTFLISRLKPFGTNELDGFK